MDEHEEVGRTMNREILKRLLNDRVCNTCQYYFGYYDAGAPCVKFVLGRGKPKNNTCDKWSLNSEKIWGNRKNKT